MTYYQGPAGSGILPFARARAQNVSAELQAIADSFALLPDADRLLILKQAYPDAELANKYLLFGPDGQLLPSAGTGVDAGLRGDLADLALAPQLLAITPLAIGLFTAASTKWINSAVTVVQTSGYGVHGRGAALYQYDPAVDAAYVAAHPRASFRSMNGRGFRIAMQRFDVLMFGADPTGTVPSTDAFNAALMAEVAHSGNETMLVRKVEVPAGSYILGEDNKTVWVRKGQHLAGAGQGASRIILVNTFSNTAPIIQFGNSPANPDQVAGDPGGLAAELSGFWFFGGPTSHGVVDTRYCAGWMIQNCFFTSCGIGIYAAGSDGLVNECMLDQGLTGVVLDGQNIFFSDCLFYQLNYQVRVVRSYDCSWNDCQFEYPIYNSMLVGNGSSNTDIRQMNICDSKFTMNGQYETFTGYLSFQMQNGRVMIGGSKFINCPGYAVSHGTGIGNKIDIFSSVFDGRKTNPFFYDQSTTMGAVNASNMDVTMRDCIMRDLPGQPIAIQGVVQTTFSIHDSRFDNCTGGATEININSPGGGSVEIVDCTGSDRLMFNPQSVMLVRASGLKRWLPLANASGRQYVKIPTQQAASIDFAIRCNAFVAGNGNYRKTSRLAVQVQQGYDGANPIRSCSSAPILKAPATAFIGELDIQFEIDTLGGGASVVGHPQSGFVVASWPDSYAVENLAVELVV